MTGNYHPQIFETRASNLQELADRRLHIFPEQNILDISNKGNYRLTPNSERLVKDNTGIALPRHESTPLTSAFFSKTNINNIQNLLRRIVFGQTQLVIDDQQINELMKIMRYIYLTYSNHPPMFDKKVPMNKQLALSVAYTDEIIRLNKLTLEYIVPKLVNELQAHLNYLRDASSPIQPLGRPVNTSITGQREYRPITEIFTGSLATGI